MNRVRTVDKARWPLARASAALAVFVASLAWPRPAAASLLSPELEDALAGYIAVFVIFFVPVVLIVLFWLVHILPEKIAHNRHHPQFEAIRTLCLLSLVFGGLLWPIAWIWAYSKPVFYKMAYGTDTGPAHDEHPAAPPPNLRDRLARLEANGASEADLAPVRADIEALESKLAAREAT